MLDGQAVGSVAPGKGALSMSARGNVMPDTLERRDQEASDPQDKRVGIVNSVSGFSVSCLLVQPEGASKSSLSYRDAAIGSIIKIPTERNSTAYGFVNSVELHISHGAELDFELCRRRDRAVRRNPAEKERHQKEIHARRFGLPRARRAGLRGHAPGHGGDLHQARHVASRDRPALPGRGAAGLSDLAGIPVQALGDPRHHRLG